MEAFRSCSLITVSVHAGLFEVMNHRRVSQHPGCFPLRTSLLKVVCCSTRTYYPFVTHLCPQPVAVGSTWLSEFSRVCVSTLPVPPAAFALYESVSCHWNWVNSVQEKTVVLPSQCCTAIISTFLNGPEFSREPQVLSWSWAKMEAAGGWGGWDGLTTYSCRSIPLSVRGCSQELARGLGAFGGDLSYLCAT